MKKRLVAVISLILVVCLTFSSCAFLKSRMKDVKGKLIGVSYNIEGYDNIGNLTSTTSGKNIDITGNITEGMSVDEYGNETTSYSLSSVITITIDGKEMESCGDTLIFAEKGLKKDVEFSNTDINAEENNSISGLTSTARVINKYKNYFGKSRIVVIKSQLGVPICAYSGEEVYWELPDDLPKTTKLLIDGKVLYIHRANFQIIDSALIK